MSEWSIYSSIKQENSMGLYESLSVSSPDPGGKGELFVKVGSVTEQWREAVARRKSLGGALEFHSGSAIDLASVGKSSQLALQQAAAYVFGQERERAEGGWRHLPRQGKEAIPVVEAIEDKQLDDEGHREGSHP